MLVIESGAVPVLLTVTDWLALVVATRWFPKARLLVDRPTAGAGCVPVPPSPRLCGLSEASSAIETLALRGPEAVGEKVTIRLHVALTASVTGATGQLLVCAKSGAFAPVMPMLVIVSGAVPELRNVELCEPLVVPTSCDPYVRLVGESVTAGAWPEPLSAMLCGPLEASPVIATLALRVPLAPGVNVTLIEQLAPAASVDGEAGQSFVCA